MNGTQIDYGYDGLGRIFDIIHTGSSSTLLAQAFNWDAMSNKTARSINGVTESYSYDDLYRLEEFSYDDVGNRTNAGYSIGSSGPNFEMNEYIETPEGSFSYNANGNLSNIDSTAKVMAYDYRNQIVSYDDGTATTYRYDALGRRISKSNNLGETRYYSLGSRVIEETTATNNTSASYVYGNYIDEVLSMNRSNNNYFYHADDIYNVMMLSNAAGGMAEDYDYDAFGLPDNISSVGNPYLFNGREYDIESGFYNYRTRYLDPSVGRFTTHDTIGIWGDPSNLGNGYTYVGNNPQTFVDPYGELAPLLVLAIWGGGAVLTDVVTQYMANQYYGVDAGSDITWESASDALAIGIGVDGIINFEKVLKDPCANFYDKLYAGGWAAVDAVPMLDAARNLKYADDVFGIVPKPFQNSLKLSDEVPAWKKYEQKYGGQQTTMKTIYQGKEVTVRLDKPPTNSQIIDYKYYDWSNPRYQDSFIQGRVISDFQEKINKYKTIR